MHSWVHSCAFHRSPASAAARVRALARSGKDVHVYFNNDREGHAVRDALRLREMLSLVR